MSEAGDRLSRGVEAELLPHRLADALRDAAVRLPVHDERIDAAADIVDRGVAGDGDRARVRIDLDLANGAAVRENRLVHLVVGLDREPVLELVGQVVLGGLPRQLEDIEGVVGARHAEAAVLEFDLVRRRSGDDGRDRLAPSDRGPSRPSR